MPIHVRRLGPNDVQDFRDDLRKQPCHDVTARLSLTDCARLRPLAQPRFFFAFFALIPSGGREGGWESRVLRSSMHGTGFVIVRVLLPLAVACSLAGCSNDASDDAASACNVQSSSSYAGKHSSTYRFDEATRTLYTRIYIYELDEADRPLRVYGNEAGGPVWYWSYGYDEHGNSNHLEYRDGVVVDSVNAYDDSGRLTTVTSQNSSVTFFYDDPENPLRWTRSVTSVDGVVLETWSRKLQNGHAIHAETTGTKKNVFDYSYVADKLQEVTHDGPVSSGPTSADGVPDQVWTWSYGSNASPSSIHVVTTNVETGEWSESYSAGCGALLERFPWLAYFPSPDAIQPGS